MSARDCAHARPGAQAWVRRWARRRGRRSGDGPCVGGGGRATHFSSVVGSRNFFLAATVWGLVECVYGAAAHERARRSARAAGRGGRRQTLRPTRQVRGADAPRARGAAAGASSPSVAMAASTQGNGDPSSALETAAPPHGGGGRHPTAASYRQSASRETGEGQGEPLALG